MQDDLVEVAGDRARQIGWLIVEDLGNTPESNSLTAFLNAASESTLARLERDILATRPPPTDEMVDRLISLARRMAEMPVKNEYPRGVIGREARDCFDTARAIVAAMGEGR